MLASCVATVAFFTIACGGSDPAPTPTAEPPTETATPTWTTQPTPSATPTPDPKVVAADKAYLAIVTMQLEATLFSISLRNAADGIDVAKEYQDLAKRCDDISVFGFSAATRDLWPGPYADLDSTLVAICLTYEQNVAKYGLPTDGSTEWKAFAIVALDRIDRGEDALPDYSIAQLKRAIQDRQ